MNKMVIRVIVALVTTVSAYPEVLSSTSKSADFSGIFAHGQPLPVWNGIHLVRYEKETKASPPAPNVFSYSVDGKQRWATRVWIPGAVAVKIWGVAAGPDGGAAAVGFATDESGRLGGFIGWIRPGGELAGVTRTGEDGFWSREAAYDKQGGLWLLGQVPAPPSGFPDHTILRRYSSDGKLTAQALPFSAFPGRKHPMSGTGRGFAGLASHGERMAVYLPLTDEFLLLDRRGEVTERGPVAWPVADAGDNSLRFRRLLSDANGAVLGHFSRGGYSELYRLQREGDGYFWKPIMLPLDFGYPLGLAGEELVYRSKYARVVWATLKEIH